ncbi:MAG TPA: response regulator transcription factor [bacterium]|jgi:DNA-binding NarL/FixJ family response regulator
MPDVKLLLADDHKLFRLGLRQLLSRQPLVQVVGEAATGFEAATLARDLKPDIVLMDISMPELNGIEATRRIVDEDPAVRVIILSMHSDRRYIQEALRAGAKGYLLKDAAPEEVMRAIQKVMRNQFYLSVLINEQVIADFIRLTESDQPTPFRLLSAREREVLQLLAEGKSTREIADKLNVSVKTVETHRQHIMDKLNMHTVAELTKYAIREGLTPLE